MARFALTINDQFVRTQDFGLKPPDIAHKKVKWLPLQAGSVPAYDPNTERVTGPTYTVNADTVTEVYTKVTMSAQEISDVKDGVISSIDGPRTVLSLLLLNHENRIRVLEGKTAITMAQFKAGIKAATP